MERGKPGEKLVANPAKHAGRGLGKPTSPIVDLNREWTIDERQNPGSRAKISPWHGRKATACRSTQIVSGAS